MLACKFLRSENEKRASIGLNLLLVTSPLGQILDPCHSQAFTIALDDQTQVNSKRAGQHEHASLNQCHLKAAN